MNLIKRLFGIKNKKECTIHSVNSSYSPIEVHNQLLINKVIELLKLSPNKFSARWYLGTNLDASVRSSDKIVLIMIETGQITNPTRPEMTKEQREQVKQLINPIVEKDSKYLIDKLLTDCC